MKKSLVLGILSVACSAVSSFGQGVILLDNYQTSGPLVTYGLGSPPANGVSGTAGTFGTGLQAGWTLGFYYAVGSVTVGPDPNGGVNIGDPSTFGGGLVLATGNGSTAAFYTTSFNTPGEAHSSSVFAVPGTAVGGGDTMTLELVAYSGSSYANSVYRGHSTAFTMTTSANNSVAPDLVGSHMPAFAVPVIPEPSVFALSAIGGLALMRFRRPLVNPIVRAIV